MITLFPDLQDSAWDRNRWPNFTRAEFACKASGECRMDPAFLDWLQDIRSTYGHPMIVSSGFRHPTKHPREAAKKVPGAHASGQAADIAVHGQEAFQLIQLAMRRGVLGVGVSQKAGLGRFIHLDLSSARKFPTIWSY